MSGKVLVVDDAAFMRVTIKNMITKAGYEVVEEAVNGKDAVEKYKELNPDVVTMDITMPVMDGIEAVKNIIEFDSDARIIMCSAMGQKNIIIEAIQAGARDFIVKPFQEAKVLEAIKKYTQP